MSGRLYLQIAKENGEVVRMPAGDQLEIDLIAYLTNAILAKGVGVFKTERQVRRAIIDGVTEAISELKAQTIHVNG